MATRIPTAFTNASTTESPESMVAAAAHYGMDMNLETIAEGNGAVTKIDSKTGKPVEAPVTPEAPVSTEAEKPVAAETTEPTTEEKAAAEAEAAAKATADAAAEAATEKAEADRLKAEADAAAALELTDADKAKHKKLLKQIDKLTGRLRTEEDKSGKLAEELEDAKAKLTGIKPTTEAAEPEPAKAPERPKRPKLGDFAFDQEKYEAALETYDAAMDKYETDREAFIRDTAVKQVREDQARANAEALAQQREQEWQTAKAAYPDIDEKLADSPGQISAAMQAVLREVYEPAEAWAILDYLADNPDESTAIAQKTLASSAKPTMAEFAKLAADATRELTKLELKIQRSEAAKKGAANKDAPPAAPVTPAAPVKPQAAEAAKPVTPAAQKPPVSKAEPPITPVTSHADNTGKVDLSSEKTPTAVYLAEREKQRIERLKRRG